MLPHFLQSDLGMYKKYINKSKNYFEYGSGGSTFYASQLSTIETIYSVESDPEWIKKVQTSIPNSSKCKLIYVDINANGNWGNPGRMCTDEQRRKYSSVIDTIDNKKIDLVLIDGRFRVACGLKCFKLENCLILVDDFLNRPQYHILLQFYDIVEKGKIMVCLKKKPGIPGPNQQLIQKYELIAE